MTAGARLLREAHEVLMASWPGPNASVSVLVAFYRRSSAVYREVADIDREHRGDALYWAEREHT